MISSMTRGLASMLCAVVMLSGCASLPTAPPPPSEISDRTQLDETALTALEVAYKAWRVSVNLLLDAGRLSAERKAQIALLDARLYGGLRIAEAAYRAGNATNYASAVLAARQGLSEALPLVEGYTR